LNVLSVDGSEIVVKDGKNHGTTTYYYPNGQKEFEANYMNGLKDGELIDYDKQGKVKSKEIYKNGKRIK
jgi:antitoxin component YwqK of YwqJK toxin-antitoxin module